MSGPALGVAPGLALGDPELAACCAVAHALVLQARAGPAPVDVTEAERRRRDAHELVMGSRVPIAVLGGPGEPAQLVNRAWAELLGSAVVACPELDAVFRTGSAAQIAELAFQVGAGREVYCRVAMHPLRGAHGAIDGVIVVCADITNEIVTRRLGVDDLSLVWSGPVDRGADYHNQQWHEYTGAADGEAWQRTIHPADLPRCMQAFGEAARQRVSTDIEARVRNASGGYHRHRVRFVIASPAPRWFGCATNIDDTRNAETERAALLGRERAARADAEQANRLKDQFLAAVSHELRGPLSTMLLWDRVLRDHAADPELHAQALDAIHQSAIAQSHLVADLLDVARGVSGKLFVDLRPLEVGVVVGEAVAAAGAAAAAKHIALTADVAAGVGEVQGDAYRLRQVFGNLISNAIKFTRPGGRVAVSTSRDGGSVVITIADTGRGIAAEFLPRLFEPFSQTDDALTRAQGGLGLGLSIAHQLVALHQGTLVATSAGRGAGATFTVTLPVVGATLGAAPPARVVRPPRTLDRLRVLIVDDDRSVREALVILLGRAGAVVDAADSAASARDSVARAVPDAMVCDIAMPDEDGYSLIRTMREAGPPVHAIPMIALTAHATTDDGRRALASGFDVHLAKPIDFELLVASIHDLVTARRA